MPTGKIMIVDDEEDVREAIKLQLAGKNFKILEAGDGAEAIATMKQEDHMTNVGVILCDIRMPNVDGVECIDYLKAQAPGIPIVVITAFPDAELPLSDYPEDYLYNLVFYGGKSVGKSPNMPDWGMTIPKQDLADLLAYLRTTFKGE